MYIFTSVSTRKIMRKKRKADDTFTKLSEGGVGLGCSLAVGVSKE